MEEENLIKLRPSSDFQISDSDREMPPAPTITRNKQRLLVAVFAVFSIVMGYIAATQPKGKGWRFFSYHPLFMTISFVGLMGSAAVTKKLGGYTNTKIHGIAASSGLLLAYAGLYVIYRNKEMQGKHHLTTTHALAGIITMTGTTMASMAGGIFLHPDFGVDKTNKTIRTAHKWFSRSMMLLGWITCWMGLNSLTADPMILAAFAIPLMIVAPATLL